ncbi:MAG: hypothetical protein ACKO70_07970 [Actinomycetota bacterium]
MVTTSVVQRGVEPDAQGRVYGIQTSLFYALPPVFMLATGVIAERTGVMPVLLGLWVLMTIVALGVLMVKSIHDINA